MGYYLDVKYHFGAQNAIEHLIFKFCYSFAAIITNYPTEILFIVLLGAIILILAKIDEDLYIYSLILSAALALQIMYII